MIWLRFDYYLEGPFSSLIHRLQHERTSQQTQSKTNLRQRPAADQKKTPDYSRLLPHNPSAATPTFTIFAPGRKLNVSAGYPERSEGPQP